MSTSFISLLASGFALAVIPACAATPCDELRNLKLPDAAITLAKLEAQGTYLGPAAVPIDTVPSFCRVAGVIRPSKDSDIQFEVWLPQSGWNGRFRGVDNGGFAGSINYAALAAAVKEGFAAASTDTGHHNDTEGASWALGHPEKIVDFGYRGIHEMTTKAKIVVQAFYGERPKRSYFEGCSNGGRQGLMEAQRYPDDYDGILAGAPANFWTHLVTGGLYQNKAALTTSASYLPASKIPAIHSAVLQACDAGDGVKDGIVSDPVRCHFSASTLLCKGAEDDTCLTGPQVKTLEALYGGAREQHGQQFFPGVMPGGEEGDGGWKLWITGSKKGGSLGQFFVSGFFGDFIFDDPKWDFKTTDVETAMHAADAKAARTLNAVEANLKPFEARGGKLILYHGWSDAAIPPLNAVNYYQAVISSMGRVRAAKFIRLYMVPGMQHCAGGPGPNMFGQVALRRTRDPRTDVSAALEDWVEKGSAPATIVATKYADDRPDKPANITRPLCPYPALAKYKGSGDTNEAANFTCVRETPK